MALPKINHPIFTLTIPSKKTSVKFRPFLVKEEKVLLIAQNSGDPKDIILAIKQVINNCTLEEIDIDSLTTFDLEYLFIKLRSKSINNIIELKYTDPEDGYQYDINVDIDKIEVINLEKQNNKIEINSTMGMTLKYPNANVIGVINEGDTETDMFFSILKYSIESIYDGTKVYNPGEYSSEEIEEFIYSLDVKTLQKVQEFFENIPKIHSSTEYTTKDGKVKTLELNTLNDFFMLG